MMKRIIMIALVCLMSGISQAQVNFGVKGGVNVSRIGEIHEYSRERAGLQAGIFAQIPLGASNKFFIQPEVLWSSVGEINRSSKYKGLGINEDIYLNYVILPVMFKAYLSGDESDFFFELGPQVGYLVNSDLSVDSTSLGLTEDNLNKLDLAASIGAGYSFNRNFELSVRYTHGFMDVIENDQKNELNPNQMVTFAAAFLF